MKKLIPINGAAICTLFATVVTAQVEYLYAPVVESRPLYRVVEVSTPREECWEEEVVVERERRGGGSSTPVVLSTIIGGAIGNAVGHNKSNQRVGAVVGAVLGHSIGRDIVRNSGQPGVREYRTVERCRTVYERHEEERLSGYQVTYNYNGQDYSIRTDSDPGDEIRIRVSVQPVL
ncbi:MAG: glycine zipper 2TM domain-containing protein [Pseudohongiellaceae bacterium]